jgi:allantoate deiminase
VRCPGHQRGAGDGAGRTRSGARGARGPPPEDIAAYLELHIEQGPCLEQEGLALGVVEAINGARRLNCRFTGEAGHAGTVPMNHRKDALAAAAEWMVLIENTTRQQGGNLVATVGNCAACPAR